MAEQDQRSIADIDAETARLKMDIQELGWDAQANAESIQDHGYVFGPPGHEIATGGLADWAAPTQHPVWADEMAHEAGMLEDLGAAPFEYEPIYQKLQEWATSSPIGGLADWAAPKQHPVWADEMAHEAKRGSLPQTIDRLQARLEAIAHEGPTPSQDRGYGYGAG